MSTPDLGMIVDVVDDQNNVVGRSKRGDLLASSLNFRTVHVIVRQADNRLILQRLPKDHLRSPDKLGSSAAGYLKAGESYKVAAARKLWSELKICSKLEFVDTVVMNDVGSRKYIEVFTAVTLREPEFDPLEVKELVFLTWDELRRLVLNSPTSFTDTFLAIYGQLGQRIAG